MVDVEIHPTAEAEYRLALGWYQARSPQAAARFEVETERAIESIRTNPGLYPIHSHHFRFVMIDRFPHYIVYEIFPDLVHVVAFVHAKEKSKDLRDRV